MAIQARGKRIKRLEVQYKRPPLYAYQKKFLDGPERYSVIEASTKIGKTAACIIWLFEQALNGREGDNFIWLAPIYAQAKIAFKRMIKQAKTDRATGKSFFTVNKSDLTLTLPNKAVIHFKSADNPDSLYGEDYRAAVFDEASRAKEEANNALRSTLTKTGGKVKYIANVRGRGWYYRLAQTAKNGGNPDYAYHRVTCWDAIATGRLDAGEVIAAKSTLVEHGVFERLLRYATSDKSRRATAEQQQLTLKEILDAKFILPAHAFRETYEAQPSEDGGNPFGIANIQKAKRPALPGGVASTLSPVCLGIDLGSRVDFTVLTGLDKNKAVSFFKRYKQDWNLTKTLVKQSPDIATAIDGTGVGAVVVEELQQTRKHTESFIFTAQSKQRLIEALVTAFQMGELTIPDSGPLVDELESFEYSHTIRGGIRYEAPTGLHDDCVMSLALAYDKFRAQPKPVQKSRATLPQIKRGFRV